MAHVIRLGELTLRRAGHVAELTLRSLFIESSSHRAIESSSHHRGIEASSHRVIIEVSRHRVIESSSRHRGIEASSHRVELGRAGCVMGLM